MRSKRAVYVRVTDAELDELEAESNSSIDLKEFIPIKKIDPVYFERAYYLGAEKPAARLTGYLPMRWAKAAGSPWSR